MHWPAGTHACKAWREGPSPDHYFKIFNVVFTLHFLRIKASDPHPDSAESDATFTQRFRYELRNVRRTHARYLWDQVARLPA